jgi:cyclohexyl-isocyanide hydratase
MNNPFILNSEEINSYGFWVVTAGIDFALTLAAEISGDDIAKRIQLTLEYDPQPPFDCGTPTKAGHEIVDKVLLLQAERIKKIERNIDLAAINNANRRSNK